MNKLKNKIFGVLFILLTIILTSILIFFNINSYHNEYKEIDNKINRLEHYKIKFDDFISGKLSPIFMDQDVYIINFDSKKEIKRIYNFTENKIDEIELLNIVKDNIKENNIGKINNLYFDRYIITFANNNNNLIIIDNIGVNNSLIELLRNTIILFILLEIIIIYLSYVLTRWMIKPVEKSFEKQKQFIYDASHELKTPLAIIMGSAESVETNKKNEKWINNIKEETDRMNKLVKNLLELSKTEYETQEYYEEVNLSKIIEKKSLLFESIMFENNLSLELNIEKNIFFKCDQERIKELLSILIDNAIKHSYKDSIIKVNLYNEKDKINIEVINNGDEIPNNEKEKIFERFYRADKSRNRDSNRYGLGLAIAKNIVKNHNGVISVESQNNITTFKVTLKK